MMTELLTTSNTTACSTTAPCLNTDPSLEDKERMADHWQGLLESSVKPILKIFFNCVVPGRKVSSTESKTWWHQCVLLQIQMDYPKIKGRRGVTFSHIVMVVCISSSNTEFWHGVFFSSLFTPPFFDTNQMRLSIFPLPCDCWKDIMRAIFWLPATVSQLDGDTEICSLQTLLSLLIPIWKGGGGESHVK